MTKRNDKDQTADDFLTVGQVARLLQISEREVRRWIATGALRVHRFGRAIRISREDLDDFIRRAKT